MEEIWKPIANFEDWEVSNLGRVRHLKIIAHYLDDRGVPTIKLRGKQNRSCRVKRLVADAFLDASMFETELIGHLNGDITDNRAENLEIRANRPLAKRNNKDPF